jgi:hypothetical protein
LGRWAGFRDALLTKFSAKQGKGKRLSLSFIRETDPEFVEAWKWKGFRFGRTPE